MRIISTMDQHRLERIHQQKIATRISIELKIRLVMNELDRIESNGGAASKDDLDYIRKQLGMINTGNICFMRQLSAFDTMERSILDNSIGLF